ncbi:MAG TPA: creatininase family protein [Tepidisphaeraceae bacterium]|jgi:creatinine amidohydrolase|nr:creatininase family protein [Tepidisphaeraceae bacterium]
MACFSGFSEYDLARLAWVGVEFADLKGLIYRAAMLIVRVETYNTAMSDFILEQASHGFLRQHKWEVAVLPFGATEPHNYHMPYGTDTFQVEEIGRRACEMAYKKGAKALLLPAMPFGVNTNHLQVKGALALSVTPTTLLKVLADLVDSLERQGLKKLVLLNGHGGNELKPLMRELHHRTKLFLCLCDWYRMVGDQLKGIFKNPGEHADEMETSLGLAFFPQFMKMDTAGSGTIKQTKLEAINKGWISITRPWHLATEDTGMGDPSLASAEKGQKVMDIASTRLGEFLYQLAITPMDERFPY